MCDWTQTCWPDIGENPDHGYINYDNVFWGMLQGLSLLTLSKWETQYHDVRVLLPLLLFLLLPPVAVTAGEG